ncbi:NmrA family NAD(P)-binding protein [Pseudactinotalea suaedae]|uniref:NmrA family NAD(P)-binding protein n=1 Tax=Pseudactinotalea suaedae TaxID=1524924 RepID=UPI0012E1A42C|nr:NAD(P)H-binding protein [Pseudactinotalea suaedae]
MTTGVMAPKGNVGAHVLRLLIQAGERPRALLRDPGTLDSEVSELVETATCDVGDPQSVIDATAGLSALYWVSPTAMDRDPVAAHREVAEHLSAAVQRNGIERVVFQSSGGAEKRQGVGEIDGLAAIEVALDACGASVTHLRCGYFFTNLLMDAEGIRSGALSTAMDPDRPLPWVAPADVAAVAASRLLGGSWTGRHVQGVHGPEDLSFRDVASVLAEVLGHDVTVNQVSDDDVRTQLASLGMGQDSVEAIVGMTAGIRDDYTPEQPRSYVTTTPTTLRSWASAHLT